MCRASVGGLKMNYIVLNYVFRRDSSSAVEPATCTRARRRPPWRGRRRAGGFAAGADADRRPPPPRGGRGRTGHAPTINRAIVVKNGFEIHSS